MNAWLFWASWSPVILMAILAVGFKQSALALSVYSFFFALLLSCVIFSTPVEVALMAGLDGLFTTLPLLLVIWGGILLSSLLMATGSLKRIVGYLTEATGTLFQRNIMITLGVGNFMEGAGVIAEPVVAPMLHAAGVSPAGSAALSIIGYAGLMTLELAGIIITVLALVTGLPVQELGMASAWLSIPAVMMMVFCVPLFLPQSSWNIRQLTLLLASGLILGLTALGTVAFIGIPVSGMLAGLTLMILLLAFGAKPFSLTREMLADSAPFIFLLTSLSLVHALPFVRHLAFEKLAFHFQIIPVHTITLRPFFSSYLYLGGAFLVAVWVLRVPRRQFTEIIRQGTLKGGRAFAAMALFGAMGQMLSYTGYAPGFNEMRAALNIPLIISQGLEFYTGSFYPAFVPVIGWVGTFLTGYGVASLMLFGQLQVEAAGLLGVSPVWLSAGLAVGASLGSISSPFKIALATPMCGAVGREGVILRWTIPLGLVASIALGLILWLWV